MKIFGGFTRLCTCLTVVLVAGHVSILYFPSVLNYLALIPAKTIPFAWNLITAGYSEQTTEGVIFSSIALLFTGKLLEPIWGSRELMKFIFLVNFLTSACVFITAIFLYCVTTEELYLYLPISGFHGAIAGLLVGIKQIVPDRELPLVKIKARWLPSLAILVCVTISFFRISAAYVLTFIFGAYVGWIYLRYWQKKPETKLIGDPSDRFAFSTFFPEFFRSVIDPAADTFARMCCRRRPETSDEIRAKTFRRYLTAGSQPIDTSRRRERAARALEQRMSNERLASIERTEVKLQYVSGDALV